MSALPPISWRPRRGASVVAALALSAGLMALAGCSSGSGGTKPSGPPSSPPSTPLPKPSTAALTTAHNARLGTIVTDGQGWTLYRFDADSANPSTSRCTGQCATVWPPEPAVSAAHVHGVDHQLVGSVTRPDGTRQLTLNGWPLYRYAGDGKPGDTNGQNVLGAWHAATPQGRKAGAGSSSGPSSGYGY
ncbi:hypothetical protein ACWGCW_17015 [Streptomyces sp. NPDC054933]